MSTQEKEQKLPWWRNEDWLAVVAGGLLIFVVMMGWRPAALVLKWTRPEDLGSVVSVSNLTVLATYAVVFLALTMTVIGLTGGIRRGVGGGFCLVFVLAVLAQWIAENTQIKALGLEYVIFGLALGSFLNHLWRMPDCMRLAVRTEFYIKTGLVILGTSVVFREVMEAGVLGLIQAALVVTVVWGVTFRLARWLKVDDEFGAMLSSAVSICGVSAAIATCGAIQGDRKKLSYVTSLVLVVAVPMMVAMPWIVKEFGIPPIVGGAWLGGTLDTSGSVVAAGQLLGEEATKAGVIVKLSQNVLIGVAAFALSVWWSLGKRKGKDGAAGSGVSAAVIWERFPKFVLGFLAASLVFSFAVDPGVVKSAKPVLTGLRNIWFAMAFVSIGLETRFNDLLTLDGGRPALAFLGGQAFNVVWTLILAWLLFGGLLVAVPVLK